MKPSLGEHPFLERPHRTLFGLALPVLISLVAEPVTGLVDTAFMARAGGTSLAALGVGTVLLSGLFWAFNFLGIGTQTSVARALGSGDDRGARRASSTAALTALLLGVALALLAWPWIDAATRFMGADATMAMEARIYLEIRLFGAPAILLLLASFGALRGLQDMQTPLRIAVGLNLLNIALDYLLVFGAGPVRPMGLAGVAIASVISQWGGAVLAFFAAQSRLGGRALPDLKSVGELFVVGRDLVVRTGSLLLFLLLATRASTQLGEMEGAAHQAIRQSWVFGAFLLDAWAASAQSLIGFFLGAGETGTARRVAGISCGWALLTGLLLMFAMLGLESGAIWLLVPPPAESIFRSAWWIAAIAQPLNALSFVTDGIHWGTGDYRYLRNVMLLSTVTGAVALMTLPTDWSGSFVLVWWITVAWIGLRALFGLLRIWPGIGAARLQV
ncbi:MAG: MATE family efflux transporter [Candidatus Binatia bacterium]|nr:MATE family efflux transporter [Candidatus Binatia bacterium]MDG2008459.1 MATE family efflux transporter [Candidatus Binatia bacterium]